MKSYKDLDKEIQIRLAHLDKSIITLVNDVSKARASGMPLDPELQDMAEDIALFIDSCGQEGLNSFLKFIPEEVQEVRPFLRKRFWDILVYSQKKNN
jgi:hypothetical protein